MFGCPHMINGTDLERSPHIGADLISDRAARFRVMRSNDKLPVVGETKKPNWRIL